MIILPDFDPVALDLGPIKVHWYGLMYVAGFTAAWLLGRYRIRKGLAPVTAKQFEDLLFGIIVGLLVGARLGYVFFYNASYYLAHPAEIFAFWQGGMSFHGGFLGVTAAIVLFCWRNRLNIADLGDFIAPIAPPGLFFGRMGNFLNSELWGRPTDVPWGMVFPDVAAGVVPRHPSQLYEGFLEGIVLFTVLWLVSAKRPPRGTVMGLFLLLYGAFRFLVEFTRQPDPQLGFIAFGWLTMGQLLSSGMVVAGAVVLAVVLRKRA